MNTVNFKDISNFDSILELGSRTIRKIISRMDIGCALCGWKESICDIHHIIDISFGGTNSMENLILVCPNHHRIIHTKRDIDKQYSIENLQKYCLAISHKDWKSFYNIKNIKELKPIVVDEQNNICINANCSNKVKRSRNKFCGKECATQNSVNNIKKEILIQLLTENNFNLSKVGRLLNFSDNAIRKICKIYNIEIIRIKRTRVIHNKIVSLNEEQIKYIIDNYKERDKIFGCRGLGRKFKVHHTTIMDVLHKYKKQ